MDVKVNGDKTEKHCTSERLLSCSVAESCWVDGTDCQVCIRSLAITEVLEYLESRDQGRCGINLIRTLTNIRLILEEMDGGEDWRQPAWTPGMRFDYVSDDDWVVSDDDDDDKSTSD